MIQRRLASQAGGSKEQERSLGWGGMGTHLAEGPEGTLPIGSCAQNSHLVVRKVLWSEQSILTRTLQGR